MDIQDAKLNMIEGTNTAGKITYANPAHIVTITFMASHEGIYHILTMSDESVVYVR